MPMRQEQVEWEDGVSSGSRPGGRGPKCRIGVEGLGFRVWGSGFRVECSLLRYSVWA